MRRIAALVLIAACSEPLVVSPPDAAVIANNDAAVIANDDAAVLVANDAAPAFDDAATFADAAELPMHTVSGYGALGSSSTAGSGASRPELAYVPLLHARLQAHRAGAGGVTLTNRGEGGAKIDRLLARLPELERARPEVVTILPLGDYTQTTPDRFRTGYEELLSRLDAVGSTIFFGDLRIDPALLCGVGSGPGGCYGTADRDTLAAKNAIVAELARAHPGVIVVPVFDQNAAHPEWNAPDGHPNDLGHGYLADTFFAAIGPWLDRP